MFITASQPELQAVLEELLGSEAVYFQPPPSLQMQYPCIIYKRYMARTEFAGNGPYRYTKRYQVIIIDRNPNGLIPDKIAALPMCVFDRYYAANNLHHDVFNLYF